MTEGEGTYGTEQGFLMSLLPQLYAIDAHSCLRQGPFPAACAFGRAHRSCGPLSPRHPQYDLDLMVVLQGCSRSLTALYRRTAASAGSEITLSCAESSSWLMRHTSESNSALQFCMSACQASCCPETPMHTVIQAPQGSAQARHHILHSCNPECTAVSRLFAAI